MSKRKLNQMNPRLRYELKTYVYEESGGICYWCGSRCSLEKDRKWEFFTIDHVIPRWRGGPDRLDNLVAACRSCNQLRDSIERKLLAGLSLPEDQRVDRLMPVNEFRKYPENGQVAP